MRLKYVYNIVDTVLILSVGLGFGTRMCLWIAMVVDPQNNAVVNVVTIIIPLLASFIVTTIMATLITPSDTTFV